jgi:hypothetical protein
MQLFEDRISGGSPTKRLAVLVVVRHKVIDALHELLDTGERASANGLVRDLREESLDLVSHEL